ncbi:MAG: hypothetical protein M5T61_20980 [Acidimicrobiia bacterium]|nr:hypothetical protein [Acidimicrobiia bacterium]
MKSLPNATESSPDHSVDVLEVVEHVADSGRPIIREQRWEEAQADDPAGFRYGTQRLV